METVIVEKPIHPQRVTVWCGLWAGGIIGPYFFQNESGEVITVNGVPYRGMVSNFFWPESQDMDVDDKWFQEDGVTLHTANEKIVLLSDKFNDRFI